ncbi:MAG: hypothetical protein K2X82_05760, partial [Gemmataceae bacterium]|nr:hypothetical protein [Gemmataceae bacterium]
TGPEPAADGRRAWRVRLGGRSRLEFTARGPSPGPGPVLATLAARYDLSPGYLAATFDFDLQPTRGPAAEWSFAVPPGLRVTAVEANDLAGWRVAPSGRELRATLRRPGTGGKVRVEVAGELPLAGEPLPVVRPAGAVGGDERAEVRVDPGLAVEAIDPGDYRLAEVAAGPDDDRVFTFVGSRPAGDPPDRPGRRPPAVRVRGGDAGFAAFEAVEWRVAAGRVALTARVTARPRRGPLFGLTVRTPPGFTLDRAATIPDDRVAFAGPTADGAGVQVEFARPVAVGQAVELVLSLRGPAVPPGGGRFPFPALATVGAAERDGWVAVCPGPGWSADVRPDPGAAEVSPFDPTDPPPPDDAAVTYLWRGREPAGDIALTPITPSASAAEPAPAPAPSPAPTPAFTELRLATVCSDPPMAVFEGAVRGGEPGFTVDLPAGAEVEAVTVGGRAVDPAGLGPGPRTRVPVPAADGQVRFEVRYRLGGGDGPWRRVDSPVPELPGGPHPVRRAWVFPVDAVPVWPLLPAGAEAAFAGEEFVVVPGRVADAAGVILAAGLAVVGWVVARRRGRWSGVLLLLVVAAVGGAGMIGPAAWGRAARPAVAV